MYNQNTFLCSSQSPQMLTAYFAHVLEQIWFLPLHRDGPIYWPTNSRTIFASTPEFLVFASSLLLFGGMQKYWRVSKIPRKSRFDFLSCFDKPFDFLGAAGDLGLCSLKTLGACRLSKKLSQSDVDFPKKVFGFPFFFLIVPSVFVIARHKFMVFTTLTAGCQFLYNTLRVLFTMYRVGNYGEGEVN